MLKKLLILTAISTTLISTSPLAADSSMNSGMPQTTGQSLSGPNDAGGQANTNQDPSRNTDTTGGSDENKGHVKAETSAQEQDFEELDRNKDGSLDEEELNRFGPTTPGSKTTPGGEDHGKRMLKMHDHDGDGSVSQQELEQGPDKSTSSMDN